MTYNNGQTMTLRAPNGTRVRVRFEVNVKARRLILRLDERRREAVAVAPSSRQIKDAAAFAAERAMVDVDCSRLRRVDFVSAGIFFNILATLRSQGKLVVFRHVNNMVAALLRVMGVDQVAQIVTRR